MERFLTCIAAVLFLLPLPARAGEAAALMATLPTLEAECRYAKQLMDQLDAVVQLAATPHYPPAVMERALQMKEYDFQSAYNIVKERHGTEDPCSLNRAASSAPAARPSSPPPAVSSSGTSENQRKALIDDFNAGKMGLEEYRHKRDLLEQKE